MGTDSIILPPDVEVRDWPQGSLPGVNIWAHSLASLPCLPQTLTFVFQQISIPDQQPQYLRHLAARDSQ